MSFAIIKCGSKQFRVQKGLVIDVEKLPHELGEKVVLTDVLFASIDGNQYVGQPTVSEVQVVCEVLKQKRAPKVTILKFRRRKNSRRRMGHRQHLTVLRIVDILLEGTTNGN